MSSTQGKILKTKMRALAQKGQNKDQILSQDSKYAQQKKPFG